jgi:hypothetical protein
MANEIKVSSACATGSAWLGSLTQKDSNEEGNRKGTDEAVPLL